MEQIWYHEADIAYDLVHVPLSQEDILYELVHRTGNDVKQSGADDA